MDPYLFICLLGLTISVSYGQMQMVNRRNFPPRQAATGGGMMGSNGNNMNPGVTTTNGQGTGMVDQGQGQAVNGHGMGNPMAGGGGNNNGGMGQTMGGAPMGGNGFGMMGGGGGGIDPSMFMGGGGVGGGNRWMQMNMAMNGELPPMMMGGNFNPRNFVQYRACEKTPSNFNQICNPQMPNQCQTGTTIAASMPAMMGMRGMGGMGGMGQGGSGQNMLVCSRMTEHGIARCCARNLAIARMLDKMFK